MVFLLRLDKKAAEMATFCEYRISPGPGDALSMKLIATVPPQYMRQEDHDEEMGRLEQGPRRKMLIVPEPSVKGLLQKFWQTRKFVLSNHSKTACAYIVEELGIDRTRFALGFEPVPGFCIPVLPHLSFARDRSVAVSQFLPLDEDDEAPCSLSKSDEAFVYAFKVRRAPNGDASYVFLFKVFVKASTTARLIITEKDCGNDRPIVRLTKATLRRLDIEEFNFGH